MFKGYGDAAVGTGKGLYQMVRHPVGTAKGLYSAASNPGDAWDAIYSEYSTLAQSDRGRGQIIGEGLITIATFGAGGAASGASKAAKVGRVTSALGRLATGEAGFVRLEVRAAGTLGKIGEYNALKSVTKGTGLVRHHLIEQRFAETLGQKPGKMLSVVLNKEAHQVFTNAWRQEISYGRYGTGLANPDQILSAARRIYADYPEYLKALGL